MKVILHTNKGDILAELFSNHTPKIVHNFVTLARGEREWADPNTHQKTSHPLFDGTTFHRVTSSFMIQGGDPLGTGIGGPGCQFDSEIYSGLIFDSPYVPTMVNADKRMGYGTSGSQFSITVAPVRWLFDKHTIFGKVVDRASKDAIDTTAVVVTGANDRSVEGVVVESVTIPE